MIMGYYIETGTLKGKAKILCEKHQGESCSNNFPPPDGRILVCVVDNGPFEAAAIIPDEREFDAFNDDDGRSRRWLHLNESKAKELCPRFANKL